MTSDEDLFCNSNGSREALEELFARYRQPLYSFFRRRLSNDARADDLMQETFLAVIRAKVRYEPRALVRTYLYAIALKQVSAERRWQARRPAAAPLTDVFHPATPKRLISVADPYAPNVPVRQALAQPPGVIAGVIGGVVTPSPETQLLVRTADLSLTARDFDNIRAKLDRIILQFGGLVGELNLNSPNGEARTLNASIHIPAAQLEAALVEVRKLGHVDGESQRGEDVTRQSVDLTARLANLRHTEERLTEILRTRTGKLSDVLEVEEKLDQVRGQIEQSEAEQKALNNRVSFATLSLTVTEDYAKAVSTGLGGAALGGLHHASNVIVAIARAALEAGPTVLLFALLLGLPAYLLWKNFRHAR